MIKRSIFFIVLFFVVNANSQQDSVTVFKIEYFKTLTLENTKSFSSSYELQKFIELNISIFDKISKPKNPNELVNDADDEAVFYFTPQGDNINLVYKNYSTGKFYSKHEIARKYFLVEDSLQIFNWQILEKTKEILGYQCQLATMVHRGRTYEAWFTTDLPVGGPWKYDGLPGMILSIKSVDLFISFDVVNITSKKIKHVDIKSPFKTKNAISWQTFIDLYKKKAIALSTYTPQEGDSGRIILSRGGIETYIDENDTEFNPDNKLKKSQRNN